MQFYFTPIEMGVSDQERQYVLTGLWRSWKANVGNSVSPLENHHISLKH